MGVSFGSLEIARSGLVVSERGLYVTGHNISNVNTPGYSRQQAIISTAQYQNEMGKNGPYQLGLGADIEQIRQIRHTFLDNIYRQENTTLGYWEGKSKTHQDIEAILGEPMGNGIQNVMNQFWDSWQELSKQPDSLTVRALVRQRGQDMVQQINHAGAQLDKLQNDLNTEVQVRIDEINGITGQVAKLNGEIVKVEVSKDSANDYRDQRNTLLDRLHKMVNIEVNEMQDGQVDVTLGGYFLVSKTKQTKMVAEENLAGSGYYIPKLEGTNIEVPVRSGTLKGLMESRGEVSGMVGSTSNGSPSTIADITMVVDISNTSAGYLAKIKANIDGFINELKRPGVDYNLNLVTYDGTGATLVGSYGSNDANFKTAVLGLSSTASTGNDFGAVVNLLDTMSFRAGANKYAAVFTGESLDGNTAVASNPVPYYTKLLKDGIKTSVITDVLYHDNGFPTGEAGWNKITNATGGRLYDINEASYNALLTHVAMDNVNDGISYVQQSKNVIPDLKKQLNALVNIMAREINFLHKSGTTLNGLSGSDFFTALNNNIPLQMENIQLNSNLNDLNNIVAASTNASGDNSIALKIANCRNRPILSNENGTQSMDEYYQSIILREGNNGSDAARISESQASLVQAADNSRKAITGVSMDEEMSNLLKYKFAYDASARALNVMDSMLQNVIEKVGLVGR